MKVCCSKSVEKSSSLKLILKVLTRIYLLNIIPYKLEGTVVTFVTTDSNSRYSSNNKLLTGIAPDAEVSRCANFEDRNLALLLQTVANRTLRIERGERANPRCNSSAPR